MFRQAFDYLINIGFVDVVIPVILVYAIMYSILAKTKILGDPANDDVRARISLISLSVGFIFAAAKSAVHMLKIYLPDFVLVSIFALFGMAAVGVILSNTVKENEVWLDKKVGYVLLGLAALLIIIYFLPAPSNGISIDLTPIFQIISVLVTLGIMVGIAYFITKGS
ncbi:NEQ218 [Nanoarchaeum equitans Kin4-M]|uniref:NEQ218 n=1 Tax=Nanoarchaeum equitans (strain Kin4-M) TaxID=228908 RepID=Q74MQ8_NANEQ|nr:NEQ218 [Nanoarchaeum equitans Kin4-M]